MKSLSVIIVGLLISLSSGSYAQQRRMPGEGTPPIKVGSDLADVTAYDEAGNEFPVREKLSGKPAVLVFGCLT